MLNFVNVIQFLWDKIFCHLANVHVVITLNQYNPVWLPILGAGYSEYRICTTGNRVVLKFFSAFFKESLEKNT